jgi:hypothetical protein
MLLVRKPEGKRPLVRPRCRRVDNLTMDLGEIGWSSKDGVLLPEDRVISGGLL